MTLPSSGSLSASEINVELSRSATSQISLGDTIVRNLANVSSGAIGFNNLRGKAAWSITLLPGNEIEETGDTGAYNFPMSISGAPSGSTFSWSLSSGVGSWSLLSGNGNSFMNVGVTGVPAGERYFITVSCTVTKDGTSKSVSGTLGYDRFAGGFEP